MKNCITNMHNQRQGYVQAHTCYILDPHLNMFQDQTNRFLIDTKISYPRDCGTEGQVLGTDGNNHVYWKSVLVEEAMAPLWDKEHREPYQTGDYVIYNHRLYIRLNDEDPESLEQLWIGTNWQEVSVAEEFYKTREKISDVETQSIARDNALGVRIDNADNNISTLFWKLDNEYYSIEEADIRIAAKSHVEYSQALGSGRQIGTIKIDNVPYTLYCINDYEDLSNQPSINGHELYGNQTGAELDLLNILSNTDNAGDNIEIKYVNGKPTINVVDIPTSIVIDDLLETDKTVATITIDDTEYVITAPFAKVVTEEQVPTNPNYDTIYLIQGSNSNISQIIINGLRYNVLPEIDDTVEEGDVLTVNSDGKYSWQTPSSGEESDPIFTASPAAGITTTNINNWNNKSTVSGTASGANWSTITIDGTTKNIPAGGSTTVVYSSDVDSQHKIAVGGITVNGGARQDIYIPQYLAGSNISITQDPTSHDYTISSTGGGGSEPSAYLKSASVSGNTLTLTNKDNSTVQFTPSGGGGTSNYNDLTNKPSINNVPLSGDKPLSDLGIASADELHNKSKVVWTQLDLDTSHNKIAQIKIDNNTPIDVYAPTSGGGGGEYNVIDEIWLNNTKLTPVNKKVTLPIYIDSHDVDNDHLATTQYVSTSIAAGLNITQASTLPLSNTILATITPAGGIGKDIKLPIYKIDDVEFAPGNNNKADFKIENTDNKVTSISSSATNTQYPSAAAVKNYAVTSSGTDSSHPKVATIVTCGELPVPTDPNTLYIIL